MEDFSFKDLEECLRIGREIEFSYKNKAYSITNSGGFWYFYCDTDKILFKTLAAFEDKDGLVEKVSKILIEDKPLVEIFNRGLYDKDQLYIL